MRAKRLLSLVCIAGCAAFALAAPAGADNGVLTMRKAAKVTKDVARRDCRRDADCERFDAANCRRLAPRRVSCVASYGGTDAGADYQCERLVLVRLRDGGGTRQAAGKRSCYVV